MAKHLVVVSFDAMVFEDLDYLKDMPCFGKIYNEGARVNRIKTIYPSLTYPSHVSILSGTRAGKHGVVNNEPSIVGNLKCPWYWFHDAVKVEDLHDAAKKAGLTTASVFWPVSGAHKNIDYLVAEYWAQGKDDTLEAAYKRAGTSDALFEDVIRPLIPQLDSWESPVTDEGKIAIACEMIKRYKPNLLTLHLGQVDYYRHRFGVYNDKVKEGVLRSEFFIQMLFDACKDANIFDDTCFCIVSDHGQINYNRKMNLNVLFKEQGFIKTDSEGNILDWTVWGKSANFCAQIYLSEPQNEQLKKEVYDFLMKTCEDGTKGIGKVYTADEAKNEFGLYGDFSFVIESDESTLFNSNWLGDLFTQVPISEFGYFKASHGHDPSVGPQPIFLAYGTEIKPGVIIPNGSIIDEAPTFAKILGLKLIEAEGKVMEKIFK